MRIITVARKPLSGTVAATAIRYGTGGINIDGCRIGVFQNTTPSGANRFNERLCEQGYRPGVYAMEVKAPEEKTGRWPSNLVLQHKTGCQCVGTQKIRGITGTASGKMAGNPDGVAYGQRTLTGDSRRKGSDQAGQPCGYTDAEGKETVETWVCEVGCPVKDLDGQSAGSVTGVRSPKSQDREVPGTTWYVGNHKSREYPNESGGASRFFKQIQGTSCE